MKEPPRLKDGGKVAWETQHKWTYKELYVA
jgi:hypothetical protein